MRTHRVKKAEFRKKEESEMFLVVGIKFPNFSLKEDSRKEHCQNSLNIKEL